MRLIFARGHSPAPQQASPPRWSSDWSVVALGRAVKKAERGGQKGWYVNQYRNGRKEILYHAESTHVWPGTTAGSNPGIKSAQDGQNRLTGRAALMALGSSLAPDDGLSVADRHMSVRAGHPNYSWREVLSLLH